MRKMNNKNNGTVNAALEMASNIEKNAESIQILEAGYSTSDIRCRVTELGVDAKLLEGHLRNLTDTDEESVSETINKLLMVNDELAILEDQVKDAKDAAQRVFTASEYVSLNDFGRVDITAPDQIQELISSMEDNITMLRVMQSNTSSAELEREMDAVATKINKQLHPLRLEIDSLCNSYAEAIYDGHIRMATKEVYKKFATIVNEMARAAEDWERRYVTEEIG